MLLVDRLGYRLQVLISSVLQAAGLAAIAMSADQWQVLAGGALTGLGRGMMSAPMTALVCSQYAENRVRIVSVHHASWYIGMVLVLLFVLGAFELGIGWRTVFAIFAATMLLYSPAAMLKFLPGPALRSGQPGARMSVWEIARDRNFRLIAVSLFFCAITEITAASWLPYYLEVGKPAPRERHSPARLFRYVQRSDGIRRPDPVVSVPGSGVDVGFACPRTRRRPSCFLLPVFRT